MPAVNTLKELLVEELCDIYDAEKQLVRILPKMAQAASGTDLKKGFMDHWIQTRSHVTRLEHVFEILSTPVKNKICHAMKGIVKEGTEAMARNGRIVRDAGLIGTAQRIQHFEIAACGTARSIAYALEEEEVANLLQGILNEEQAINRKLNAWSEIVNVSATLADNDTDEPSLRSGRSPAGPARPAD